MTTEKMPGRTVYIATSELEPGPDSSPSGIAWYCTQEEGETQYQLITAVDFAAYIEERERVAWNASQAATYIPVGPCHKTNGFAQYMTFEEWKAKQ